MLEAAKTIGETIPTLCYLKEVTQWYLFLHCLYWDTLISECFHVTTRQEVRRIRNIVQYGIVTEEAAAEHTAVITRIPAAR